jgi:hypothetical protein
MASFAVCFRNPERDPAADIFFSRNRLKMGRIDAIPHPTKMIEMHPFWYFTDKPFIRKTMGRLFFIAHRYTPISTRGAASP